MNYRDKYYHLDDRLKTFKISWAIRGEDPPPGIYEKIRNQVRAFYGNGDPEEILLGEDRIRRFLPPLPPLERMIKKNPDLGLLIGRFDCEITKQGIGSGRS